MERVSNCNVLSTDCERSSLDIEEGSYLGAGGDKAQQTDWAQIAVLMASNWWAECSHCRVLSKEICKRASSTLARPIGDGGRLGENSSQCSLIAGQPSSRKGVLSGHLRV